MGENFVLLILAMKLSTADWWESQQVKGLFSAF